MSLVLAETRGAVCVLSMNNPKANPLNEQLVADLRAGFNRARDDSDIRAVVLTSALEGYFSVGLDVREVFDYPRERMARFWVEFVELYEGIYDFPKPVVAALTGVLPVAAGRIEVDGRAYLPTRRLMRELAVRSLPEEPLHNACVGRLYVAVPDVSAIVAGRTLQCVARRICSYASFSQLSTRVWSPLASAAAISAPR